MKGNNMTTTSKIQFFDATQYKPGRVYFSQLQSTISGKKFAFFQQNLKFVCKRNKERNFALSLKKIVFYPILNLL